MMNACKEKYKEQIEIYQDAPTILSEGFMWNQSCDFEDKWYL